MVFSLRLRSFAVPKLVLAALLVTAPAAAQSAEDRATARLLVEEADKKLEAGEWQAALELFTRALTLVPAPTIKLAMARALVNLNQLVEAQQLLLDLSREPAGKNEPPQWTKARHTASKEAAA